ncbi:protein of unknown function DUF29 [Stanieria cyanosphaera PCC 7437]|uniref:DUF29 domain-containing protein n=1 Tax=Stanieria cyanosphaera (strain ATCC 29371 / PCC 7437) TaxID=111780 RepID=K9XV21_STAC7|nr:DUF29 domain-containing protein [Stanieria cyanosphaera]AFZ35926.1 protein of unknown function DUF29 [Stanieria cyanosphaera PCC 7437]
MNTSEFENLYEQDYYLWVEKTSNLLKERKFTQLDLKNLIEEIETLGRSEQDKLTFSLRIICKNLLQWQYQAAKSSKRLIKTISQERDNLSDYLEDIPSLKSVLQNRQILIKAYRRARRNAIRETAITNLPEDCPYSIEQILDLKFFPKVY